MRRWLIWMQVGVALAAVGPGAAMAAGESIPISEVAHIHGVGFDPKDASRLLLATHFGLFEATGDGLARVISVTSDDFMGFSTVPGRDDLLVASGHPGTGGNLGFIASVDGGITWQQVSAGAEGPVDFHAVAVSRADPLVLYGLYRGIQASRDGGKTWAIVSQGPEGIFDLAASPLDPETVFAATGRGLYASSDGGKTWQPSSPAVPVTMIEAAPDGTLYSFFGGLGFYRADTEAKQWTAVNEDLVGREFLHLAIDATKPEHLVAVTHAGEVLESADGGRTWSAYGTSLR